MASADDRDFFTSLESAARGHLVPLVDVVERLVFDDRGLVPAIAQDVRSDRVLMLAWMNRAALNQTISTGKMTYWSRGRQSLWVKGETSGHFQHVVAMYFDCDGDAVLCKVDQVGRACHTQRESCFYLALSEGAESVYVLDAANTRNEE